MTFKAIMGLGIHSGTGKTCAPLNFLTLMKKWDTLVTISRFQRYSVLEYRSVLLYLDNLNSGSVLYYGGGSDLSKIQKFEGKK